MLHVHHYGDPDGTPLIALHSLTSHAGRWRDLTEQHLPGVRVTAPDLRGHGQSTQEPPWTLDQHAQDVHALLDEPAAIVGHSFGATVAVHLSRTAPERITQLILLDPSLALPAPLAATLADQAPTPAAAAGYRELARPPIIPPPGIPTTLVIALRSKAVPAEHLTLCRQELGEDLHVIEIDCGHQIPRERPTETARIITAALSGTA